MTPPPLQEPAASKPPKDHPISERQRVRGEDGWVKGTESLGAQESWFLWQHTSEKFLQR